jgi:hypothetical protein
VSPDTNNTRTPNSRRLVRGLIPFALAAVLFGLLVWPGLAYNFGEPIRLSTIGSLDAANPDIVAAGDYVGVVWSEGYNRDPDTKEWGNVYLKSADVISGWAPRVKIFDTTVDDWGREPRLAIDPSDPTQVHLVWAQASECGGSGPDCQWTSVRYTSCDLSTRPATCASPSVLVSGRSEASTPDVAVDSGGGVHVVWREGSASIRYCKKGSCGSPAEIGSGQHPSLAYANGSLHAVWDAGSTIEYRRDDSPDNITWNTSGSRSWWDPTKPLTPQDYEDPSYPAIDARGDAVYVVWALKKTNSNRYALAFDFYDGSSATWQDTSGANIGYTIPGNNQDFATTTLYESDSDVSYLFSLKPDVAITGTNVATGAYAHVVWHGKEIGEGGGAYEIWYTYLPGIEAPGWTPVHKIDNQSSRDAGDPAVAIGSVLSQTHAAYMLDADGKGLGGTDTLIDVWYIGAFGNRDQDTDRNEGIFLPVIVKKSL